MSMVFCSKSFGELVTLHGPFPPPGMRVILPILSLCISRCYVRTSVRRNSIMARYCHLHSQSVQIHLKFVYISQVDTYRM